jgi:hypothetical protein
MTGRRWVGLALLLLAGCSEVKWQEYSSKDGRYTVEMPGSPKTQTFTEQLKDDKGADLGPITLNAAVVELPRGAFLAAWADLPPKIPVDLKKSIEALAGRYQGKIKGQPEDVEIDGFKGKSFVLDTTHPYGQAVGRVYQVQNRLYQLLVLGENVQGSSEAERFLKSFKLVNPLLK